MTCKICQTRRPRRYCPGVSGEICPVCCGTERENSVACPLDCPYLQESRRRDKPVELAPEAMPHADIRITDAFLENNAALIGFLTQALSEAALGTPGAIDGDVREALDSLVRSYRTRESGLYYDTRPSNLVALRIFEYVTKALEGLERDLAGRQGGASGVRDADVLGSAAFLDRLERQFNNGRRRSRAFIDFLRKNSPEPPRIEQQAPSGLVIP
jgi:hypothetical protein